MEISCITLSFPKLPPSILFTSSHSPFLKNPTFFNPPRNFSSPSLVFGSRRRRNESAQKGLTCNAFFGLGVPELVVIAGVAALVFGPKQLPEVGRSIGKTVKSFQQAAKEFESELKKGADSESDPPAAKPVAASEEKKQDVEVSSAKESV